MRALKSFLAVSTIGSSSVFGGPKLRFTGTDAGAGLAAGTGVVTTDFVEAYEKALAADPEFADAHCNLGTVFYNQERKSKARDCFNRTLEFDPRHLEAHLNLAVMLEEEGRQEAALVYYKRADEIDPLCAETHVSLALYFLFLMDSND